MDRATIVPSIWGLKADELLKLRRRVETSDLSVADAQAFIQKAAYRREEILDKVLNGDLAPQQAEELAEKESLEPFQRDPDPAEYIGPLETPHWTLSMCGVWAYSRSPEAVAKVSPEFLRHARRWFALPDNRYQLSSPIRPFSLVMRNLYADRERIKLVDPTKTLPSLKKEIIRLLQEGSELHASAIEVETNKVTPLSLWHWRLDIREDREGRDYLCGFDGQKRYQAVEIPRTEILKVWPPKDEENPKAPYMTDSPGRPSAIQFVEREADRRRLSGETLLTLADESRALHQWCEKEHPTIAAPQPKTIENRIRVKHNASKSRKPTQ